MSENVTASTATRDDTFFILISIIKINLLISWFIILFVLWIWKRFTRSSFTNWALEEVLATFGNPVDEIQPQISGAGDRTTFIQPHPGDAGDRPILTSYSNLCTELSIRMNETPMNRPLVELLVVYCFLVEVTVHI